MRLGVSRMGGVNREGAAACSGCLGKGHLSISAPPEASRSFNTRGRIQTALCMWKFFFALVTLRHHAFNAATAC